MFNSRRYPFQHKRDGIGVLADVPYLPLTLTYQNRSVEVMGLLDTGASVNVLPYNVGVQLGAIWEEQRFSVTLAGNLASAETKGLLVLAKVGDFDPVQLVFAWTRVNNIPILLGRTNFFTEFDVGFYGSQLAFEVCPKFRDS
ncbi:MULTISPECIES: retroviral-like aspartic protease [unclassified Microcoleus]|uniref:retroviral-like aspartic protease n=1 Tax=unclassified Microcoleus TaxID=2642155 RepID=UPI002FD2A9B8